MLPDSYTRRLLPLSVLLIFCSLSWILWQSQNSHQLELVSRHTETSAEQVHLRVEGLINARITSLELMADRWVERKPPDFSHQRFLGFADVLYRHYPGYLGIFWIDPEGRIAWVFPEDAHAGVKGKPLSQYSDPSYSNILRDMTLRASLVVMPCVPLHQGGFGFHVLRALVYDGSVQGFLDGVFKVEQIMGMCLSREVLSDFCVRVIEGGRMIYRNACSDDGHGPGEDSVADEDGPVAIREINFAGRSWTLRLEPSPASYAHGPYKNLSLLGFGLALSLALSLSLYFLLQRMEMLKASRDHAIHEVSERKRAQAALRDNEKKLQALLDELTAKNAELESFVYTVSHDLKTPIVTIEGFIGALREDFTDRISEVGDRYLRYISDAAFKMEVLINDLLNLSRIGRLVEKKTEFSLEQPVREAIEVLRPQIEARGIVLSVQEGLPSVWAERKRIGQVVDNLLTNAVKYIGKENPQPHIEVGFEDQNGGKVFFIHDNGIGIDKRYFDKIFQIFERLPQAKLVSEGTGVGLTIVKRIIESHGGRIWLTSEPGLGTTFYFTLNDKERL